MPIRVLIADDHRLFTKLIQIYLRDIPDIEVSGEAENGENLLRLMETVEADVILLDLNMPRMGGLEALGHIKKKYSATRVVILSMHDADSYIVQSLEAGAAAYVHKSAEPEEIIVAIRTVHTEGYYYNDKTNRAMHARIIRRSNLTPIFDSNSISFSNTEIAVLRYLCQELTSIEIAKHVFMSARSIDGIRQKLIRKTNTKNVVGLTLFAIRNGLIEV